VRVSQVSPREGRLLVGAAWSDSPRDCWDDEVLLFESQALTRADVTGLNWDELVRASGLERQADWDERVLVGMKALVGARECARLEADWTVDLEWAAVPCLERCCYGLASHGSMLADAGWQRRQAGRD